jgi:hypothetical protein
MRGKCFWVKWNAIFVLPLQQRIGWTEIWFIAAISLDHSTPDLIQWHLKFKTIATQTFPR